MADIVDLNFVLLKFNNSNQPQQNIILPVKRMEDYKERKSATNVDVIKDLIMQNLFNLVNDEIKDIRSKYDNKNVFFPMGKPSEVVRPFDDIYNIMFGDKKIAELNYHQHLEPQNIHVDLIVDDEILKSKKIDARLSTVKIEKCNLVYTVSGYTSFVPDYHFDLFKVIIWIKDVVKILDKENLL